MPVREPARGRGTDPARDNHLYIAQFGVAEGVKHIFLRRINCLAGLPFSRNGTEGIYKIGLLLLFSQHVMPVKGVVISLSCESHSVSSLPVKPQRAKLPAENRAK